MKFITLALIMFSSIAHAAGPFNGVWNGAGTLVNSAGSQSCTYNVKLDQTSSEVTVEYVQQACGSQVETYYGYVSSAGTFYDQFGNSVGTLTANEIQLRVESNGYADDITFELQNGQLIYSEHYNWAAQSRSFDAKASLLPVQN